MYPVIKHLDRVMERKRMMEGVTEGYQISLSHKAAELLFKHVQATSDRLTTQLPLEGKHGKAALAKITA
jgi:hypothetical protein